MLTSEIPLPAGDDVPDVVVADADDFPSPPPVTITTVPAVRPDVVVPTVSSVVPVPKVTASTSVVITPLLTSSEATQLLSYKRDLLEKEIGEARSNHVRQQAASIMLSSPRRGTPPPPASPRSVLSKQLITSMSLLPSSPRRQQQQPDNQPSSPPSPPSLVVATSTSSSPFASLANTFKNGAFPTLEILKNMATWSSLPHSVPLGKAAECDGGGDIVATGTFSNTTLLVPDQHILLLSSSSDLFRRVIASVVALFTNDDDGVGDERNDDATHLNFLQIYAVYNGGFIPLRRHHESILGGWTTATDAPPSPTTTVVVPLPPPTTTVVAQEYFPPEYCMTLTQALPSLSSFDLVSIIAQVILALRTLAKIATATENDDVNENKKWFFAHNNLHANSTIILVPYRNGRDSCAYDDIVVKTKHYTPVICGFDKMGISDSDELYWNDVKTFVSEMIDDDEEFISSLNFSGNNELAIIKSIEQYYLGGDDVVITTTATTAVTTTAPPTTTTMTAAGNTLASAVVSSLPEYAAAIRVWQMYYDDYLAKGLPIPLPPRIDGNACVQNTLKLIANASARLAAATTPDEIFDTVLQIEHVSQILASLKLLRQQWIRVNGVIPATIVMSAPDVEIIHKAFTQFFEKHSKLITATTTPSATRQIMCARFAAL